MIIGMQIIGIIFTVIMMYFTFVHYKRKNYGFKSFLLWIVVWLGALTIISFPKTIYGVMETLQIQRTADFITLAGFAFFSIVIFYLYSTVKKNNYKIEQLVRQLAIREAELKDNGKNRDKKKKK